MDEKWTEGAHRIRFTSNPHFFYLLPSLRSVEQRQSGRQPQRLDPRYGDSRPREHRRHPGRQCEHHDRQQRRQLGHYCPVKTNSLPSHKHFRFVIFTSTRPSRFTACQPGKFTTLKLNINTLALRQPLHYHPISQQHRSEPLTRLRVHRPLLQPTLQSAQEQLRLQGPHRCVSSCTSAATPTAVLSRRR